MKTSKKNNIITYLFSGELEKEIIKCQKELNNKQKDTSYLLRRLEEENKRFAQHSARIEHLKSFIRLAEEKIAKRNEETHE